MTASDDSPTHESTGALHLGLADREGLRWAAVDITKPLEDARRRLDLSPVAVVALGRTMAAAALLLRFTTKDVGRTVVEVLGDGPLGKVIAEAYSDGGVRGLVGTPQLAHDPSVGLSVGTAVGKGLLRVSRERRGKTYQSQVELVDGEIGNDLAHYLDQSEQIRSAAMVGVLPRPDGIAAAGGLLVEALPGAEDAAIGRLEANIGALQGGVSTVVHQVGLDGLVTAVMQGFAHEALERYPLVYRCRCSVESLAAALSTLPVQDLDYVTAEDGTCEAVCGYCGARHRFDRASLGATH